MKVPATAAGCAFTALLTLILNPASARPVTLAQVGQGAPVNTAEKGQSGAEAPLGASAYARSCAGCHGPQARGGVGPPIAGRSDAGAIAEIIRNGRRTMPALGAVLSPAEVEAVVTYLGQLPR